MWITASKIPEPAQAHFTLGKVRPRDTGVTTVPRIRPGLRFIFSPPLPPDLRDLGLLLGQGLKRKWISGLAPPPGGRVEYTNPVSSTPSLTSLTVTSTRAEICVFT